SLVGSIRTQYRCGGSRTAATVAACLSTNTRRQASPCGDGQGAGIETRQNLEPTPGFLPSQFRDQHENFGTKRMAPSEGTTGQRTVTPRMPGSVAIRYVSNGGS